MPTGVVAAGAARVQLTPWPPANLCALLDEQDAVVCCAHVAGGRDAVDLVVREILADAINDAPERHLVRAPGGKPYLASQTTRQPLNFNISHSGSVVLVALSRASEVGVDVERIRAVPEWRAIAERMFDAATCERLFAAVACGADEGDAFIREWCRHEAAVKAIGDGLFAGDTRDDANDSMAARAELRILDLHDLPLPAGAGRCRGALALRP